MEKIFINGIKADYIDYITLLNFIKNKKGKVQAYYKNGVTFFEVY